MRFGVRSSQRESAAIRHVGLRHEEATVPDEKGQSSSHDVPGEDDLTRISGIESKTAQRLNEAGIRTYAELTSRSPDEIARLLPDLPPARLPDWREPARRPPPTAPPPPPPQAAPTPPGRPQNDEAARP